jgi:ABC-type spermidine/putrescine transport system permease subunit I
MDRARSALLLLPATLLSAVVFLAPFAWLVTTSFRVQAPGSWLLADGFTTANYQRLAGDPFFAAVFLRTVLLSLAATALCLVIGLPIARLITRSGRLKGILIALMLMPLVCGALLPSLGMIHLLGTLGVVNQTLKGLGLIDSSLKILGSLAGVLFGLVQAFLPLMVLPLVNTLSRLPGDLELAAASLGAPRPAIWRRVLLPLAAPGIKAGCVLVFAACFTSFVTPQVIGQGKIAMFGTVAYQQAALVLDWPFASTLAVAALALLALGILLVRGGGRLARGRAAA